MTKNEFMTGLKLALSDMKIANIDDIVADYEEHFSHALAGGKTEEEVSKKLGNPVTIAKAYETESMITTIKDSQKPFKFSQALTVLGRLAIIAPFNFLVLCIPGAVLFSLIVAGWSVLLAFAGVSVALMIASFQEFILHLSGWFTVGLVSTSLTIAGIGTLIALLMYAVTKQVLLYTISYLQWNLKFILER